MRHAPIRPAGPGAAARTRPAHVDSRLRGNRRPNGTSYRSLTLSHGFQPVIDALNALSTTPTWSSCQGDGSQATFYELLAEYDQTPGVLVRIDLHCAPAIDNRTLQAANAKTVVPLLDDLLR